MLGSSAESTAENSAEGAVESELASLHVLDPRDSQRFLRVGLVAASGSAQLTAMLVGMLKAAWCDLSGRTLESLTREESTDLDFIYGGLVFVLADPAIRKDTRCLARFLERPLGKGIAATIASLSAN